MRGSEIRMEVSVGIWDWQLAGWKSVLVDNRLPAKEHAFVISTPTLHTHACTYAHVWQLKVRDFIRVNLTNKRCL